MNKVYEIQDDFVHPGGQWILEDMKFRDVTRYMLGVTGLETNGQHQFEHPGTAFEHLTIRRIGDITVGDS